MSFRFLPGYGLSREQCDAFALYQEMLLEGNSKVNLTAITDPESVEIKHFLDSLLLARSPVWQSAFKDKPGGEDTPGQIKGRNGGAGSMRAADVGSGAGFPGVPLKIAYGDMRLDILEATGKRAAFLQALTEALALEGVRIFHMRAEDAGQDPAFRESYDWVFARGVAAAPVLLEYCMPLLKIGGYMAAYKGPAGAEEGFQSKKAAAVLGGRLMEAMEASLPENQGERRILIYQKIAATPGKYPRKPGTPAKDPIK